MAPMHHAFGFDPSGRSGARVCGGGLVSSADRFASPCKVQSEAGVSRSERLVIAIGGQLDYRQPIGFKIGDLPFETIDNPIGIVLAPRLGLIKGPDIQGRDPAPQGQFRSSDRVGPFAEFLTGLGSDTQPGGLRPDDGGHMPVGGGYWACALDNAMTPAIRNRDAPVLSERGFKVRKTQPIRFANDLSSRQSVRFQALGRRIRGDMPTSPNAPTIMFPIL